MLCKVRAKESVAADESRPIKKKSTILHQTIRNVLEITLGIDQTLPIRTQGCNSKILTHFLDFPLRRERL
jgi:hypothetical protein